MVLFVGVQLHFSAPDRAIATLMDTQSNCEPLSSIPRVPNYP